MFDMLYINDKTKSLVHFTIESKSFNELYLEINDREIVVQEIGRQFESIISQFGLTLEVPAELLDGLKDEDLDDLLINLHSDPKHLFTENFFAVIPPNMMRDVTDTKTLRCYSSLGVNRYGVLIKSIDEKRVHLAAADFEEFRERFVLMEKR